jgi:F0F1-type ATP synthase assembly protein I
MPFNRPIPQSTLRPKASKGIEAWVEAEKLMQFAMLLPCAAFIGWLAGAWLDHRFHQHWMAIAGVVFGALSGLFYVIRMALEAEKKVRPDTTAEESKDESDDLPS